MHDMQYAGACALTQIKIEQTAKRCFSYHAPAFVWTDACRDEPTDMKLIAQLFSLILLSCIGPCCSNEITNSSCCGKRACIAICIYV